MSEELIAEIRALREAVERVGAPISEVATAELISCEDPLPAKLDELITEQKRTNELLTQIRDSQVGSDRHAARVIGTIESAPLAAAEAARRAQQKADRDIPD